MDSAAAVIRGLAAAARAPGRIGVVGITGPVGAGKSTVAARVAGGDEGSVVVVRTDDYLPDYERTPEGERDLPEASDLARLRSDVEVLRAGKRARIPVWSFLEHRRVGEVEVGWEGAGVGVGVGGLIVVEGLHALHGTLDGVLDIRVYVEAPAGVRWGRWEALEKRGDRGWGVEVARAFFEGVAEPTFGRVAAGYRAGADVVVVNG